MEEYSELRFQQQLEKALSHIRKILDEERMPQRPVDVPHTYADKFVLANTVTNLAVSAVLNCFAEFGLTPQILEEAVKAKSEDGKAVTVRFQASEKCTFSHETSRNVESATKVVTQLQLFDITSKTVTEVKEFFWNVDTEVSMFIYFGNEPEQTDILTFFNKKRRCVYKTGTDASPRKANTTYTPKDLNITWLVKNLKLEKFPSNTKYEILSCFSINRTGASCFTPRRNPDVNAAITQWKEIYQWSQLVIEQFRIWINVNQNPKPNLDLSLINEDFSFVPVLALFVNSDIQDCKTLRSNMDCGMVKFKSMENLQSQVILKEYEYSALISEQVRSLKEKRQILSKIAPLDCEDSNPDNGLITSFEATLVSNFLHLLKVAQHARDGVEYIEQMLRDQLVMAIGKQISPSDFDTFMRFHNSRVLLSEYGPKPFCYAVRRPDHDPEGVLSIEKSTDKAPTTGTRKNESSNFIYTFVRHAQAHHPMKFALNAAVSIEFFGHRFLHAWMPYSFSDSNSENVSLCARARQFSCYVLLAGNIASGSTFVPKAGIVIKNKDDLSIPLCLDRIPSAKEFRDAIESLSPEQQRFAKAYRAMQLESSLFAVLVVQIKPQLEKLLQLPYDSLTKEVELTQNLMDLFISYQIPSDLLSYSGKTSETKEIKIEFVRKRVEEVMTMIKRAKEVELFDAEQKAKYDRPFQVETYPVFGSALQQPSTKMKKKEAPRNVAFGVSFRAASKPSSEFQSGTDSSANVQPTMVEGLSVEPSVAETKNFNTSKQDQTWNLVGDNEYKDLDQLDLTKIPGALEQTYTRIGVDHVLRPTIITTGSVWNCRSQKGLLGTPFTKSLGTNDQDLEKDRAFDLLDALTRSGSLSLDEVELHVIVASTHCFDETLTNTIIQKNENPIESVERSVLTMVSTIHQTPMLSLMCPEQVSRLKEISPQFFQLQAAKEQE